jgi:hypothetical protein
VISRTLGGRFIDVTHFRTILSEAPKQDEVYGRGRMAAAFADKSENKQPLWISTSDKMTIAKTSTIKISSF